MGVPRHRVVVVGGGFGGLRAVQGLRGADVDVTLVDRRNFHLFQPLTYQVATGALSPSEVAYPLRALFRRARNVRVLMADVTGVDLDAHVVTLAPVAKTRAPETLPYDTLVVAAGSQYSYFGNDEFSEIAHEVKSLESALTVRAQILSAFEDAELELDDATRRADLTFVVVGGGPTGVEMAGQIAEMARSTLPRDFRAIAPRDARILLVEGTDRVLTAFAPSLSEKALRSLQRLGVEVLLQRMVVDLDPESVTIERPGGERETIAARTVVWAAGVTASALAQNLGDGAGAEVDRAGRLTVGPDLTLPGHPEVLALGDMVRVRGADGELLALPGVAPVAIQQGRYAARLIRGRLSGTPTEPFAYVDKGNLATIGRGRAVAELPGLRLSGLPAWIVWLVVHLWYLIGFQNRLLVLIRWVISFFTQGRGARLITGGARDFERDEITRSG
jgi:NADH:ubiquinone reductase (H+-translocating)